MAWATLVLGSLLLPSLGGAEPGPEQAVLKGFFATFDRVPGVPYCGRAGGGEQLGDMPERPVADHFNGTNVLFDEHFQWHSRYATLRGAQDAADDRNRYGDAFVLMHRHMVGMLDAWRRAEGLEETPPWDPATPIPAALAYAPPDGCQRRASEDPAVPLPGWLSLEGGSEPSHFYGYTRLCEVPDLNRLGKETDWVSMQPVVVIEPSAALQRARPGAYHSQVHAGVGGDMDRPWWSMRDPVFWGWHKYLDTRFQLWERACALREPVVPTAEMAGMRWLGDAAHGAPAQPPAPPPPETGSRPAPAPGFAALLGAAGAALLLGRGRR